MQNQSRIKSKRNTLDSFFKKKEMFTKVEVNDIIDNLVNFLDQYSSIQSPSMAVNKWRAQQEHLK